MRLPKPLKFWIRLWHGGVGTYLRDCADLVFRSGDSVNTVKENSVGRIVPSGDVFGWLTIPLQYEDSSVDFLTCSQKIAPCRWQLRQQKQAGMNFESYDQVIFIADESVNTYADGYAIGGYSNSQVIRTDGDEMNRVDGDGGGNLDYAGTSCNS